MTTLRYLYVDAVDCKATCKNFQIVKRLNSINYATMHFVKTLMDALITAPAIGDEVQIDVTCADGTNVTEFNGQITSIIPEGRFYEIRAKANARWLSEQTSNTTYTSSTCETIFEAIAEDGTGLTFSNPGSVTTGVTIDNFQGQKQDKFKLLKRLSDMSVSGSAQCVFYQDGSDDNTLIFDRFGRQATGITLAVGTAIIQPVEWTDSVDEKINNITLHYSGGVYSHSHSTGDYARTIHAYFIDNNADAVHLVDKLLYDYENTRTIIKTKVRHDYLNTGTYYDVLCATYSITDATIGKSAAGPYTCIEHKINYPGFIDDVTFGSIYQDLTAYQKSLEDRIAEIERTRPSTYASDTLRVSHDAAAYESSTSYQKKKTITFSSGLAGLYRVKFTLAGSTGADVAWGRVYKNGATFGLARSTTSTSGETFSEDFSTQLAAGDTLELWAKNASGEVTTVTDFRVYYDFVSTRPYGTSISTP